MSKEIRLKNKCHECDGEGYVYHCDDYHLGSCVTGWDVPCEDCGGRGFTTEVIEAADPKWSRLWKQMEQTERQERITA